MTSRPAPAAANALRSLLTPIATWWRAVAGGRSLHSAWASRSPETTWPCSTRRAASSTRSRGPPSATGAVACVTWRGPRIWKASGAGIQPPAAAMSSCDASGRLAARDGRRLQLMMTGPVGHPDTGRITTGYAVAVYSVRETQVLAAGRRRGGRVRRSVRVYRRHQQHLGQHPPVGKHPPVGQYPPA